jgi:hypothetical protein
MYNIIILKSYQFFILMHPKNETIPIFIFLPTLDIINIIIFSKVVCRSLNSPKKLNLSFISRTWAIMEHVTKHNFLHNFENLLRGIHSSTYNTF